jgi:glutaredoxin-related protein
MTVEQMVRDILEQAVRDGLVAKAYRRWDDPSPQARTSGELVGTANLLLEFLRREAELGGGR